MKSISIMNALYESGMEGTRHKTEKKERNRFRISIPILDARSSADCRSGWHSFVMNFAGIVQKKRRSKLLGT